MDREIERILTEAVDRGDLVGAAAAVVTPNGVDAGAAGQRTEGAAMTPDTIVWIASMTKAITAVAVMRLVEEGRLDLDAPCGELVPYLAHVQVLDGFRDDGEPLLRAPVRPVTLRHLLTHTAGFGYDFADASIARLVAERGLPSVTEGSRAAYEQPLLFDPGERWGYGINLDWAGLLIEAVTGTRADEYLASAVLEPLGMRDTGFARDAERRARSADMFLRTPDGPVQIPFDLPERPEVTMAGGGLFGTVLDYLRFTRMVLGGGELEGTRLLSADSIRVMAANHIGELAPAGWHTANPILSNDVDLAGIGQGFGFGFLVNAVTSPEGRAPGSIMWAGLANTYYWIDPASQVAGVFATQVLPFFDEASLGTFRALERAVYAGL
jgi:CubicO group peptidase (beta-lactamase class C family)